MWFQNNGMMGYDYGSFMRGRGMILSLVITCGEGYGIVLL